MERWQVDWITKHLVDLQRNTRCTVRLLNALQSKEILDWDEVTELDDETSTAAKVKKFYSILITKNCYDILTVELGNCKQDGAEKILRDGKAAHEAEMKIEGLKPPKRQRTEHEQPREQRFAQGPEGLKDFLNSEDHKVMLISTMDFDVTLAKIRENVDRRVCMAEDDNHLRELMLEYSLDSPELFVFRCEEFHDSDFVEEVVSWSSNGSKAILLVKDRDLSNFESKVSLKTSKDILRWTDLKHNFQKELLEKHVKYQVGWETRKVREIFDDARARRNLQDEKLLLNLVNEKTPALFRALPDAFSYYVQRKIRSRFVLNKKVIFREGTSDIFLVTGIGAVDLSRYLSRCKHSSDNSSSQVRQLSVNYILLEHTDHFDKICEKAKGKGVHWIHHENGKFFWAKSGNGSMKRIKGATEGMTEENLSFSETEFISLLDKREEKYGNSPVLIADTPGMGKSTLLQNLARKILEKSGTKIVLFVPFSDLVNLLRVNMRNGSEITTETFENALLQLTTECGPELGKSVLKTMMMIGSTSSSASRNKIKVELMLDGYDEINSDNLPLAKKLLALLRNSYHFARIWVATRPHLMYELENDLHVVGFTILPFDESNQEKFLTEFWQSEKVKAEGSSNCSNILLDLIKFAKHCLENVKRIWVKNSEKEDICGVPLQCLLIAKVYLDDCLSFTNRDKMTTDYEPRLSLKVTSIKDLYESLIQKKLEIYAERYAKEVRPEMKRKLLNIHYFFALQLLFPKYAPVFESALTFDGVPMTDILNLGIVESTTVKLKDSPPSFGHRTIPEFLVARFVAEQLSIDNGKTPRKESTCQSFVFTNYDVGNLLFDGVLQTLIFEQYVGSDMQEIEKFKNQALVFFLDSLLDGLSLDKSRLEGIVAGRPSPIKACIYGDHLNLFKALKKGYEKVDTTILVIAVQKASKLFLEYICSEYNVTLSTTRLDYYRNYPPEWSTTLLHIAAESREFSFVEFLLNCHGFEQLVKDFHPSIQTVVHVVVHNSNKNPEWLIKEKIQILRKLVELNRSFLCVTGEYGPNPLLYRDMHMELTLELLGLGENPLVKKKYDESCIFYWCQKLSGSDFHRVVTRLTEEQLKDLLNGKADHMTILHYMAMELRQPKKETLEYLLKLGANFSIFNGHGETCLHLALVWKNVEVTRLLLDLGMHAIVNVEDRGGRTPLDHLLMSEENDEHFEELWELMISYGATFSTDTNQVLLTLMSKSRERNTSQVRFLLENVSGAKVNARDYRLNTPLHICVYSKVNGMFEMALMLLEKGAELEAHNSIGETPLQILVGKHYFNTLDEVRTLTLLLSKGALIGSVEKAQATFLRTVRVSSSLRYEQLEELTNLLVEQGAELRNEQKIGGGNSLLNECVRSGLLNGVKYLLANGISVNEYIEGETALHVSVSCAPVLGRKKEILQHLLENGANVNAPDADGLTPLEMWFKQLSPLDLEVFLLLVAKDQGTTALKREEATRVLFLVAQYEKGGLEELELLQIAQSKLLEAADVRELDDIGNNILHYAAEQGHATLVRFFLQQGADVNVRNICKQTPLHAAVDYSSVRKEPEQVVATLKELFSRYSRPDTKAYCDTILKFALQWQSPIVVKYVLETGHFDEIINDVDFLCKIVSHVENLDNFREFISRFRRVTGRSLQDVGRDSTDPEKTSLLHAALENRNNYHLVTYLLEAKLFVLSPMSERELLRFSNLLHLCVRRTQKLLKREVVKRMNIILKLAHHNSELLNTKDKDGRTPLLVENVHISLLLALVELGADCNCVDHNGNTVDQLATKYLKTEDYNMFEKCLIRKGYSAVAANSGVTSEDSAEDRAEASTEESTEESTDSSIYDDSTDGST